MTLVLTQNRPPARPPTRLIPSPSRRNSKHHGAPAAYAFRRGYETPVRVGDSEFVEVSQGYIDKITGYFPGVSHGLLYKLLIESLADDYSLTGFGRKTLHQMITRAVGE